MKNDTSPTTEDENPEKRISISVKIRKWIITILAGIFAWVSLVSGILAWRLTSGPIQLNWLAPRIENALNAQSYDYAFSIGGTIFTWSSGDSFIELQVKDFKVQTSTGIPVALFPTAGVTFDWWAVLRGEIALKGLSIKDPTIAIKRFKDGTFSIINQNHDKIAPSPKMIEPTKKQTINALMNTILLKSESTRKWTKSLQHINISKGRVIFIEEGHKFKWIMPGLNASLKRNDGIITINAKSNLQLLENIHGKTVIRKQGDITTTLISPNDTAINKNKLMMELDNIDMRFITQFLLPAGEPLQYNERLQGKINLDLTQTWLPEIIDMNIKSGFGNTKGSIVFLPDAAELSTNINVSNVTLSKIMPMLTHVFPATDSINMVDSKLNGTISTDRFSLIRGGKINLDTTIKAGSVTMEKWFNSPVSFGKTNIKTDLDFKLSATQPKKNTVNIQNQYH